MFCTFPYIFSKEKLKMNAKKLYRKPNEQMIAGVCSGLA
ncbi:MAG: PspC domain-containing protein, partial [Anaerolineaceae bacterium]|nr:PspC domain-containing protein [Anaerolineaceae bacterium]